MGFPKDKTLTSKSMFVSESPGGEGSGAKESQELVPETKMLGLQNEGAYKRKHLAHKLKYCMHLIISKTCKPNECNQQLLCFTPTL
jgi:hypothetical protein